MEEDDDNFKSDLIDSRFNQEEILKSRNKKFLIFLIIFNIILIGFVTFCIIRMVDEDSTNSTDVKYEWVILKKDKDFIKPSTKVSTKVNLEFELVEVENGMKGIIIRDPFAQFVHAQFQVENGYLTDTIGGLAHLDEHMIFAGSEKYPYYSYERTLMGTSQFTFNGYTFDTFQTYYISSNNKYYKEAIDIMLDAFRYPSYNEEIIKKEIQPINSEFYTRYRDMTFLLIGIVRQLSSTKTSFNGFLLGNNQTLIPNNSMELSKKLKQYHMLINRPENIFFTFYSNLSMNESEEYISNNFSYEMHKFSEKELDKEYKKNLEKNMKDLKNIEIFDENIYEHGFYFNSNIKENRLFIFFHIGKVDYKDIQFDLVEYYDYLFNSKTLIKILQEKEYIIDRIKVFTFFLIENNNVIDVEFSLTEKGLNELEKYIEILKTEGFKKEYFDNFIKFKQNLNIKTFKKERIINDIVNNIMTMTQNYRLYGENQIFTTGTPSDKNYNENKLKNYLKNIKYEKSFFGVNCKNDIDKNKISKFLESTSKQVLKYYNADFFLGKIPNDYKNKIKDTSIDGLKIRDTNPYFSNKIGKDIPCYENKSNNNTCKDLNEFDFENEDKYNATLLNESDQNYITYYQIDKSSESFLVNLYFEFKIQENELFLLSNR